MIHAVPERLWYVKEYLLPQLLEQQIERKDIFIYVDEHKQGNLASCLNSFAKTAAAHGGTWHLQDDIFLSSHFGQITKKMSNDKEYKNLVICGYTFEQGDNNNHFGKVYPTKIWYSFPCIYIPNKIVKEFLKWMENPIEKEYSIKTWKSPYYYKETGKFDDVLFRMFLECQYENKQIAYNLKPNLVEHIDYLIGGSIINKTNSGLNFAKAKYFEEQDRVQQLEQKLKRRGIPNV